MHCGFHGMRVQARRSRCIEKRSLRPIAKEIGLMTQLPTISIVVPNFNGGATLQRTLESLLSQNYPTLEILVADGGSTDNSVDIIHAFKDRLAWWVSEKDRGQ